MDLLQAWEKQVQRCRGDVKWGRGQAEGYLDEKFSLGKLDPPLLPMYEQVSWMLYMITAKKHTDESVSNMYFFYCL